MDEQERLVKKFSRYQKHPVEYCREILGVTLSPGQADILNALVKHHRVSVKSGNSFGKSYACACAAMWHFDCFPNSKTLITSGSQRQVRWSLMNEVIQLAQASRLRESYVINNQDISRANHPGWFVMAFSSDEQGRVEGHHARFLMCVADEARTISDDVLLGLIKCAVEADNRLLFASVPGGTSGLFHATHTRLKGTWKTFSFPTGVLKYGKYRSLYPSRISDESIAERAALDGPTSPFFLSSVMAQFMEAPEDALISPALIDRARTNELNTDNETVVHGLDIARAGRDSSALCTRRGGTILSFKLRKGMDLISTGTWAEMETSGRCLCLDSCGIGVSVLDQLRAKGRADVHGINVAESPKDKTRFTNLRAELFWQLRERFEKGLIDLSRLDQPIFERLRAQLSGIHAEFKGGKLLLESKESMKRAGKESPDLADALALSFAREGSGHWFAPIPCGRSIAAEGWDAGPGPEEPLYDIPRRSGGIWSSTDDGPIIGGCPPGGW